VELLTQAIDVFLHLDQHLNQWAHWMGPWLYVLLFAVVFCETGLVVTPFLPGDSLLFAVGALSASEGSPLHPGGIAALLIVAAILGDAVNYSIGAWAGPRVFSRPKSWFFNTEHLLRAQRFYERHGGKAIVFARFAPILRTFAPFVAGIGRMRYARFAAFNVGGAIAWVVSFVAGGYFFGNLPWVKQRFHLVILGIVVISLIPGIVEGVRAWRESKAGPPAPAPQPPTSQPPPAA
jgi:membrane-associated protein